MQHIIELTINSTVARQVGSAENSLRYSAFYQRMNRVIQKGLSVSMDEDVSFLRTSKCSIN